MKVAAIVLLLAVAGSALSSPAAGPVTGDGPRPDTKALGRQVFDRWCRYCHAPESVDRRGPRFPGTVSLAAKYGAQVPAALEERTDLTPEVVRYFVRYGVLTMPPFRKTEITDTELDALGAYLSRIRAE